MYRRVLSITVGLAVIGVCVFCALTLVGALFYMEDNFMKAPEKCPMCGEVTKWVLVDDQRHGFSVGKAALGAIIVGPIGLLGGALGKKQYNYCCGSCGFSHTYSKK